MIKNKTIELVGNGHPDVFTDIIAQTLLTEFYKQDKNSKVALEITTTRNNIFIGGEVSTKADIDLEKVIYKLIDEIYPQKNIINLLADKTYSKVICIECESRKKQNLEYDPYHDPQVVWRPNIINDIVEQSPELSKIQNEETVAGDQGVIYGYYDKKRFETIRKLNFLMKNVTGSTIFYNLWNDWKLLYNTETKELSMSLCGLTESTRDTITRTIKILIKEYNIEVSELIVNPKGEWLIGGPFADTGQTNRKLMARGFGAGVPHGGGGDNGKDMSKVDVSGIIMASYLAKQICNFSENISAIVELDFKIGDSIPKTYVYIKEYGKEQTDSNLHHNKTSLNDFIKTAKLKYVDWGKVAKNGGILSYIDEWNE